MIVGISGKLGSGKDTVASLIQKHTRYIFWHNKKFATKLKQMVGVVLDCPAESMESMDFKNKPIEWLDGTTPRALLQTLGTEWGRQTVHSDIWVKALLKDYTKGGFMEMEVPAVKVYEDVKDKKSGVYFRRHVKNVMPEIDAIPKEHWGKEISQSRVRVKVDMSDRYPNWLITDVRFENEAKAISDLGGLLIRVNRDIESKDAHLSETGLDNYDGFHVTIDNNGTLQELENKVEVLAEAIKNMVGGF